MKALLAVDKIEIGDCGADGAMGSTLTEITDIFKDSVVLEIAMPEKTDIHCEGSDAPALSAVDGSGKLKQLAFGTLDVSTANLELFMGGSTTTGKWSAPVSDTAIYKSVKVTTKAARGYYDVIDIPRALILGRLSGVLKKNEAGMIEVNAHIEAPMDASGNYLSPYQITPTAET